MTSSGSSQDVVTPLSMSREDVVKISQSAILNSSSEVYKSFKNSIAAKIAAERSLAKIDERKRKKNRIYVKYAVDTTMRYNLLAQFPTYDIKFTNASNRAAPMANAVYQMITEVLMDKFKNSRDRVIAWDVGIANVVMRSREWVHLCVPSSLMSEQNEFYMQDRDMIAIFNAASAKGRESATSKKYFNNEVKYHCTNPRKCDHVASGAIMMLHRTNTNMRQLAVYMLQHNVQLLYFAIPASTDMEYNNPGHVDFLDAYVQPSEDGSAMDIVYSGDYTLNHTYTHANYLELLARTEYRIGGMIFRKEIDSVIMGVRIYKMTSFPDIQGIVSSPQIYRSWVDYDYRNSYMVYAPVLRTGGSAYKSTDWTLQQFPVQKQLFDEVREAALRASGSPDLAQLIRERLAIATSDVIAMNQIVQKNNLLAVSLFDLVAFTIYTDVYMQNFKDGKTVATLAPAARQISYNARRGILALTMSYAVALGLKSTSSISMLLAQVRKTYYKFVSKSDLPLPAFMTEPGYTEYTDDGSSNSRFTGWDKSHPTDGFLHYMPGGEYLGLAEFKAQPQPEEIVLETEQTWKMVNASILSGVFEMETIQQDAANVNDSTDLSEDNTSTTKGIFQYLTEFFNPAVLDQMLKEEEEKEYLQTNRFKHLKYQVAELPDRHKTNTDEARILVNKVLSDNHNLVGMSTKNTLNLIYNVHSTPISSPGYNALDPLSNIKDALEMVYPGTTLMDTSFFEADKLYGDSEFLIKGNRLKIDLMKMNVLRPEATFRPAVGGGHVFPSAKTNTVNVLKTMEKRNANTPDNTIPIDEDMLFKDAFSAYLKVFCVPEAESIIESYQREYVGPDEDAVLEWVSKLETKKLNKLNSQTGFDINDLDLARNTLMLKQKVKPNLGPSYKTSVKMPQSIQFDPTGKSTAVISPVIGRKVMREQAILKPNVLIMQRKSVEDVNTFINGFDWRPNEKGQRFYLEGDHEQFDKHTGPRASMLHWKKCEKFGVMPKIIDFLIQQNQRRSIASVEAGVKMFLDTQRGSGHPDTLDGNNDVNMLAIAEMLNSFEDQIEFIILQGDDFTVAVRGQISDLGIWEQEISRKTNLSVKLRIHEHGYICGLDIAHLPDGHSVPVSDIFKRALAFMSVSNKEEELFEEQFRSYCDNMKYVDNMYVQIYLATAIPKRMTIELPTVSSQAVMLLLGAHTTLSRPENYKQFRNMFSEKKYTRYY